MNITHTRVITFSPTHTSLKIARAVARGWQGTEADEVLRSGKAYLQKLYDDLARL